MTKSRPRSVFSFSYGVFDLDGTLVDSIVPCIRLFSELVSRHGVDPRTAASSYLDDTTLSLEDSFRRVLDAHAGCATDELVAGLMTDFNRLIRSEPIGFVPGAERLLRRLRRSGRVLFVSSGSPDATVNRRLGSLRSQGMFLDARGSTAVVKGPEHIELFAAGLGLTLAEFAANAFICGDFEKDMVIGRETGLYAIGVLGSVDGGRLRQAGARRIIPDLKTLLTDRC